MKHKYKITKEIKINEAISTELIIVINETTGAFSLGAANAKCSCGILKITSDGKLMLNDDTQSLKETGFEVDEKTGTILTTIFTETPITEVY